jgi:integrase
MQHVTGHIKLKPRKRGPQWYVKYRPNGPQGRQVEKKLGPAWTERGRPPAGYYTKKMAQEALGDILTDARRGSLAVVTHTGHTFRDACDEWLRYLEHEKRPPAAPSTVMDYRGAVESRLVPALGADTPLTGIDTERIDAYRKKLLAEKGLSDRTVQKYMTMLSGIFKRAKRLEWITADPHANVEKVRVSRSGAYNALKPVEVEAVARAATSDLDAAIIRVAAFTGLRLGELRELRWDDVEFAQANLIVRQSYTRHDIGPPKGKVIRSVPLIDQATVALEGLSRRGYFTEPGDLVFCTEAGDRISDDALRKRFYAALVAAGLGHLRADTRPRRFTFHDLRHTFGTLAAREWPLQDVQQYLGHKDIQTTMIYVHAQPKHKAAAELSKLVADELGAMPDTGVSPAVPRTEENRAQLSAPERTD